MKPIEFKGHNVVFGAGQPEYQPLPALRMPDGLVITCWEFSEEELEAIVKNRCMYLQQQTFNQPMQPLLPVVELGDDINLGIENP